MSYRYLCGVPEHQCQGALTHVNAMLRTKGEMRKTHSSPLEAFRCKVNQLTKFLGYTQVKGTTREFSKSGEPRLILTKKSRFGAKLRAGKEGQRNQPVDGSGAIVG